MQNANGSKENNNEMDKNEIIENFLEDFRIGLHKENNDPEISREEEIAESQQLRSVLEDEFKEIEKNEIKKHEGAKNKRKDLRRLYKKENISKTILDDFFRLSTIDKKLAIIQVELEVMVKLKSKVEYLHNLGFKINDRDNEILADYITSMERKHKLSVEILNEWKEEAFSRLAKGTLKHGSLLEVLHRLISTLRLKSKPSAQGARETSKKLYDTLLVANIYDCQRKIEDLQHKITNYNNIMINVPGESRESRRYSKKLKALETTVNPEEIASWKKELHEQIIRLKNLQTRKEDSLKSSGPNLKKQEALSSKNSNDIKRKSTPVRNGEKDEISTLLEKGTRNIDEFIDYLIKNILKGEDKKYDSGTFVKLMVDKYTELGKSSVIGPEKSPAKKGIASNMAAQKRNFTEELGGAMKEEFRKERSVKDLVDLWGKGETLNTPKQKQRKEQDRQRPNNVPVRRKGPRS